MEQGIAALRDSWDGWSASLSRNQREELGDIECRIDDAYSTFDRSNLTAEMDKYKGLTKN